MSKQINQYTKTRDFSDLQGKDLLDLDSTDDNGTTYESAKINITSLQKFLGDSFSSFYQEDSFLNDDRTVTTANSDNRFVKWVKIDNVVQTDDIDRGFKIQDLSESVRAYLSHDVTADSGKFSLSDANGEFLNASEGKVAINSPIQTYADLFVKGSGVQDVVRVVDSNSDEFVEIKSNGRIQFGRQIDDINFTIGGTSQASNNSTFAIMHRGNSFSGKQVSRWENSDGNKILEVTGDGAIRFGNDIGNSTGIGAYGFNGLGSSGIFFSRPDATIHIRGAESGISFINEDGNSGFGTTSPTAKLHVKGEGSTSGTTNFLLQNSVGADLLTVKDDKTFEFNGDGTNSFKLNLTTPSSNTPMATINADMGGFQNCNALTINVSNANGAGHSALVLNSPNNGSALRTLGDVDMGGIGLSTSLFAVRYDENSIGINYGVNVALLNINGKGSDSTTQTMLMAAGGKVSINVKDDNTVAIGRYAIADTKLAIQGSGATSATTNLLLQNSVGDDILKVSDNKDVKISSDNTDKFFFVDSSLDRININNDILDAKGTLSVKGSDSLATSYSLFLTNSGNLPTLRVDNLYNVGIGNGHTSTSSIDARLHVKAASGVVALFESNSTNISPEVKVRTSTTSGSKAASFSAENEIGSYLKMFSFGANYTSDTDLTDNQVLRYSNNLIFQKGSASNAIIDSSGNFGIGTVEPSAKLHVNGTLRLENLPTSSSGLSTGDIWNDGGTLKII